MKKAFTLIELLIAIGVVAILAAVVFVLLNPLARISEARNSNRWTNVTSIAEAVKLYQLDKLEELPGIDSTLRVLGTGVSGCNIACDSGASSTEISYANPVETVNYYPINTYSARNWFNASSLPDFSSLTVSAVLDCDGSCSGMVRVRIGNASSYTDYDLVNASGVRTDGTGSNYSWYTNTYSISKSSLGNSFFVQILLYTGSGTVKFMMDETGPAGPDPEYRMSTNGDGSQTGWNNDNGDYFIKISVPAQTPTACLDLSSLLGKYLGSMPKDPKLGSAENTYYAIRKISNTNNANIEVIACGAENGEAIQTKK